MRKIVTMMSLFGILFLAGCEKPIPLEEVAKADYGAPPPKNYQELIKADFARTLIDPTSPIYEFGTPTKGYLKDSPAIKSWKMFGWKVCGRVNSKNRMGGYTGGVPFVAMFKDGRLAYRLAGEVDSPSFLTEAVNDICVR